MNRRNLLKGLSVMAFAAAINGRVKASEENVPWENASLIDSIEFLSSNGSTATFVAHRRCEKALKGNIYVEFMEYLPVTD